VAQESGAEEGQNILLVNDTSESAHAPLSSNRLSNKEIEFIDGPYVFHKRGRVIIKNIIRSENRLKVSTQKIQAKDVKGFSFDCTVSSANN